MVAAAELAKPNEPLKFKDMMVTKKPASKLSKKRRSRSFDIVEVRNLDSDSSSSSSSYGHRQRNQTVYKRRKLCEKKDPENNQSPLEIKVAAAYGSIVSLKAEVYDPSNIPADQ